MRATRATEGGGEGRRRKWELSAGALERLLCALSSDRDLAAKRYETIRAGLLPFFARRVGSAAEALVDETIDRVCRRLEKGARIERAGPFFYGVARNVLREHLKAERRHEFLHRLAVRERVEALRGNSSPDEPDEPEKLACLQVCLGAMPESDQQLIRRYYGAPGSDAATVRESRASLARELGISPGNLRVRAHRARRRLEECYQECAARTNRRPPILEDSDVE